jgi:hypothetical protein
VVWAGEPPTLGFHASAAAIRKALDRDRPLRVEIELPIETRVRVGKQVVRDDEGRMAGVIDASWNELRWMPAEVLPASGAVTDLIDALFPEVQESA